MSTVLQNYPKETVKAKCWSVERLLSPGAPRQHRCPPPAYLLQPDPTVLCVPSAGFTTDSLYRPPRPSGWPIPSGSRKRSLAFTPKCDTTRRSRNDAGAQQLHVAPTASVLSWHYVGEKVCVSSKTLPKILPKIQRGHRRSWRWVVMQRRCAGNGGTPAGDVTQHLSSARVEAISLVKPPKVSLTFPSCTSVATWEQTRRVKCDLTVDWRALNRCSVQIPSCSKIFKFPTGS